MSVQAKLGRGTDQRIAMLRGLVTDLFQHGEVVTTKARARAVRRIAEKLITKAVCQSDVTTKQIVVFKAKLDSVGRKITKSKTSKNGAVYRVVEKEKKPGVTTKDSPSRLHARRMAIKWIYRPKDEEGNYLNVVNKLFDEIAPRYKDRKGGYTRIYKLGQKRRGDGASLVVLRLVA